MSVFPGAEQEVMGARGLRGQKRGLREHVIRTLSIKEMVPAVFQRKIMGVPPQKKVVY